MKYEVTIRLDVVSYMGRVGYRFSSLLRRFFFAFNFPPSKKTDISKFQFDRETKSHYWFVRLTNSRMGATLIKQADNLFLPTQRNYLPPDLISSTSIMSIHDLRRRKLRGHSEPITDNL